MSTISSPGLGSGLDVTSIVTQLVALERRPIEQLQAQATTIQTRLSSYGLLQSYTANVRDIAERLAKPDFWTGNTATTSDMGSVTASATATATSGSYSVEVTKLAKEQSLASKPFAGSTAAVGTGTLKIEVGAWNDTMTVFTPDAVKVPVDVAITAADNTLEKIKAKINGANAGVTASIVNDASGYRLSLRSNATGAISAVRITAVDDDGVATDAAGLSALAFNPPVAAGQMLQTRAAQNAQATINGLAVTSSTNTLTGAIEGVTLNLAKETSSAVNINVALDTATIKKGITDFAKAFSEMNTYISTQTKYDATAKKAAALQGDRSTLAVQSNLRGVFLGSSSASSAFSRLSDIGVQMQSNGTLTVNDAKLSAALANPAELAKFFSATSPLSEAQGFAVRVKAVANQLVGADGVIPTRTKSLRDSVTQNSAQQQKLEQRVAQVQARLTKQYSALDTQIAQIKAQNSALSQSIAALVAQSEGIARNS